jgi:transcription elongation factor GreA
VRTFFSSKPKTKPIIQRRSLRYPDRLQDAARLEARHHTAINIFRTMSDIQYMTLEGYNRLKEDLEELRTTGRLEASRAIAEARDKGDLSENAEYDAAKEAQGMLELKISEMEKVLSAARVINESQLDTSKVTVLAKVKIRNIKTKAEVVYHLVSETEANLKLGKISVSSPIGSGLLGKKIGEIAKVRTPGGEMDFEILDIFF